MSTTTTTSNENWLIRTARNQISGPFSREEVARRIAARELAPDDEICPSGGYWIYLDEREEVKKLLGVEMPLLPVTREGEDDGEVTETQIEEVTPNPTTPSVMATPASGGEGHKVIASARALKGQQQQQQQSQQQAQPQSQQQQQQQPSPPAYPPAATQNPQTTSQPPKPFVLGRVEKPSFWRWVAAILIAMVIFLLLALIHILQTSQPMK